MPALSVKEIWRYPVKSMRGEMLDHAQMGQGGIPGDRIWVVRGPGGAPIPDRKNALAGLLDCSARFDAGSGDVEIAMPDGATLVLNDASRDEVAAALAPLVAPPSITLWRAGPLRPDSPSGEVDAPAVEKAIRRVFGFAADDPSFPAFEGYPASALRATMHSFERYQRRNEPVDLLGVDFFPVNVLTEATLRHLEATVTKAPIDRRRFRPNIFVADDAGLAEPVEASWEGREVAAGAARLFAVLRCVRCVMPSLPQGGRDAAIARDPVFNPANTRAMHSVGMYLTVLGSGRIAVGDALRAGAPARTAAAS